MATHAPPSDMALEHADLHVIFVLGPPGAGKSTLCRILCAELQRYHLSVGDFLQELSKDDDDDDGTFRLHGRMNFTEGPDGAVRLPVKRPDSLKTLGLETEVSHTELRAMLKERKLLPPETIMDLVVRKLYRERQFDGLRWSLVDGFPRQAESAELFEQRVGNPAGFVLFDCPKNVAKARFVDRKREDDNADVFEKRYEEYLERNAEVLKWYGDKVRRVDTGGDRKKAYNSLLDIAEELWAEDPTP